MKLWPSATVTRKTKQLGMSALAGPVQMADDQLIIKDQREPRSLLLCQSLVLQAALDPITGACNTGRAPAWVVGLSEPPLHQVALSLYHCIHLGEVR